MGVLLVLYGVVRAGLSNQMKFEQRPEGGEATNHVATSEKVLVRDINSRRARK